MNNRMYEKEELYNLSLSNIHKYSLLNEIFAIRDERFPKEQQATMLCVNGYISIASLDRYKRNIDELVRYQNIGTIKEFKELKQENQRLLELCMYSLISSTSIYKHELANDTKQAFMKIIKDNIDLDTCSIREKIKKYWSDSND